MSSIISSPPSTALTFDGPQFSSSWFSYLLKRCSISQIKQVHAHLLIRIPYGSSFTLLCSLVRAYASFDHFIFPTYMCDYCPSTPPTIIWNSIIQAYSKTKNPSFSLYLFHQMIFNGIMTDNCTFTFVITACSQYKSLKIGECVHGLITKNGYRSSLFVGNALVNFYSVFCQANNAQKIFDEMLQKDIITETSLLCGYISSGELEIACDLFNAMKHRNDVVWTVMISGYVDNRRYNGVLECFKEMLQQGEVNPNEAILVCILSACAHLGAVDQGKWVHVYINKKHVPKSSNICTALVDMYFKCGRIDIAKQVFHEFPNKDVMTWTSMILGLGMHGYGRSALQVYSQLLHEGIKPDDLTLLGILKACSHSGLVNEGCSIFHCMHSWGIIPTIEHYGCLIDLLGRAGRLEEAFQIAKSMPIKADIVVWRTLLSACRVHRNVLLGEQIIVYISQICPINHHTCHVLLSNLYASLGSWENVLKVRSTVDESYADYRPGCSWIEIDGIVHEFHAADRMHPCISEIKENLNVILKRAVTEGGYIASTKQALFDLTEEEKEQAVSLHSEKLAVAFGLMRTTADTCITVVKNLRICEDCHSAMKAISQVLKREIVIRDRSRFHTFKDGKCNCFDYW